MMCNIHVNLVKKKFLNYRNADYGNVGYDINIVTEARLKSHCGKGFSVDVMSFHWCGST